LVLSPSSQPDIGITVHLCDSVEWQFRDHVEWSVDMETKLFIQPLGLYLGSFIEIDDFPPLILITRVILNTNSLALFIFTVFYIKNLVVGPVDELIILIFENLEPS